MNVRHAVGMLLMTLTLGTEPSAATARTGPVRVAFVISQNLNVIDFAGPWEVFQDAVSSGGAAGGPNAPPFELYTVAGSLDAVTTTGGARVIPAYTFSNAPKPDIVVIGAQSDNSEALLEWLRGQYAANATIASVCTGARKLALSGLLDGKRATTHHDFIADFRVKYPKVHWLDSQRFVHSGERLYTAGGLTSGIELALHLVAQRFGQPTAQATADYMEYRGRDWQSAD